MPSLSAVDRAVIDALLPGGDRPGPPKGAFDAGFDRFYAAFSREAALPLRLTFRAALVGAAWLGPLLIFRPPPISLYGPETRERILAAMGGSRFYLVRQMILILKAVTCFCYGADPEVRDAVGFPRQFDDPRSVSN